MNTLSPDLIYRARVIGSTCTDINIKIEVSIQRVDFDYNIANGIVNSHKIPGPSTNQDLPADGVPFNGTAFAETSPLRWASGNTYTRTRANPKTGSISTTKEHFHVKVTIWGKMGTNEICCEKIYWLKTP